MATFDATLGSSTATSYVDVTTADAFFTGGQSEADWLALSQAEKEAALMAATGNLEVIDYAGTRCDPSTDDPLLPQALKWPRSGITCDGVAVTCAALPRPMLQATCLLALELHKAPGAIIGAAVAATGAIQSQTLGDLSQSFYDIKEGTNSKVDATAPLVLQKFPWLVDLIPGCLLAGAYGGGGRVILRVRS